MGMKVLHRSLLKGGCFVRDRLVSQYVVTTRG
jgi:hypothetical protein